MHKPPAYKPSNRRDEIEFENFCEIAASIIANELGDEPTVTEDAPTPLTTKTASPANTHASKTALVLPK